MKKLFTTLAVASVVLIAGCNKNDRGPFGMFPDVSFDRSGGLATGSGGSGTAPTLVSLGTSANFAVLAGTTVTNAGSSIINGDLGVSPGSAATGFQISTIVGPGTVTGGLGVVNGTIYLAEDIAAQAQADALVAYTYLWAQPADITDLTVYQLDGKTLAPGVYHFISADLLAGGTLTLDFGGDPNALFIFQTDETVVTKVGSKIVAINAGTNTCLGNNVFWAVGSSATISGLEFIGNVIAYTTITMTNAVTVPPTVANVSGRLWAMGGEVTMINSTISACGGSVGTVKPPKHCRDFVTGGGWINDKETFGVSGGIKNDKFWGQLSYNNHDGVKVKSTEVTAYSYINPTTREIKGLAKVNGQGSFAYTVVVSDNGENGRNDYFSLVLSDDYTSSGTLKGGNIQLHKECGESRDKNDKEDYFDKDERDGHNNCDNDYNNHDNNRR